MLRVLILLCLSFMAIADDPNVGEVTIPIVEYTKLKDNEEAPDLTVIEDVEISGTFGRPLTMTISGARSGKAELLTFMELQRGSLHACKGNAVIKRDDANIQLLAQGTRFSLTCTLSLTNWNEANFVFFNVLHLNSNVKGAELIMTGDPARQSVSLTQFSTEVAVDRGDVTGVGHHQLTILPEENRFQYSLQLSNPSRSKKSFSVPLRNGEIIQSVASEADYKDTPEEITFSLLPGMNKIRLSGRLPKVGFKAPLTEAQNFLLIENSPMLQLGVTTKARRVSVQDTGMSSQYSTSRGYILSSGDEVTWNAKKLEVFTSTGFAVDSAHYLVYVPRKGKGIIEAEFNINNQGTPEIPLKIPGRVSYVEIDGTPQVLRKDAQNALLLQVPVGKTRVLIQYEGEESGGFIGQSFGGDLIKPDSIVSDAHLQVKLAPKWDLVLGRGMFNFRSDILPNVLFMALLYAIATYFVLVWMGVNRKRVLITCAAIFVITSAVTGMGTILLAILLLGVGLRHRTRLVGMWPKRTWAQIGVAVVIMFGLNFLYRVLKDVNLDLHEAKMASGGELLDNSYVGSRESYGGGGAAMPKAEAPGAMEDGLVLDQPSPSSEPTQSVDYQGLPARVKIPNDGRVLTFEQGMLDKAGTATFRVYLVGNAILAVLIGLAIAWLGFLVYREHPRIRGAINI